ncbi:hypothetical protein [Leptospira levettii]|uniref:Uncharacterized protein n=1 Tax=Leptospira levettii TaxID=2023178 RepID=A0AAW5VHB7_9LEPT|nr:hypothetical protein [Leptospira levettii]MCW7467681.1 hypothetical protein [Leptospira levettii]MCW7513361.1 hypothetical protein [Leptospira levettii]MCW7517084.1 hypothetical protein [Leptospira levettii]
MNYPEIKVTLDIEEDLIEYIWQTIDHLIRLGFEFPSLNKWKEAEIEKIKKNNGILRSLNHPINEDFLKYTFSDWRKKYREEQVYSYFNIREKIPFDKPRKIIYSSIFSCPPSHEIGLKKIISTIETGKNLLPFMSRQILKPTAQDGLFFEFGITHLHLGTEPDKKRPVLIKSTKEVVYCIFNDLEVYFLIVAGHGLWADITLLELVQSEFPNLLKRFEFNGSSGFKKPLSPQKRIEFRNAGINTLIEVGGKTYFPLGGGINSAGTSSQSIMKADQMFQHYKDIEAQLISTIKENYQKIQEENNKVIPELNLKMIDPDYYFFIDSERSLKLQAIVDPETLQMLSLKSV